MAGRKVVKINMRLTGGIGARVPGEGPAPTGLLRCYSVTTSARFTPGYIGLHR
jgi:hypothetical protein